MNLQPWTLKMADSLEFFFDIASPYSYLASTQVQGVAERAGVEVRWRPILLGGVFKMTGNEMPAAVRLKARYMLQDLHRWAALYDVPFKLNSRFPVRSLLSQRALVAAEERAPEQVAALALGLFEAAWVQDADVASEEVVRRVADGRGLDGAALVEATQRPEIKERLKVLSAEAVERGIFGAPAFFVGEELYWGNDRLDFVERALRGAGSA